MTAFLKTFLFFLLTIISNAQEFKKPIDYLNYIGKETDIISSTTWKYTTTIAHTKNAKKIDATRKSLIKSIANATKKIEALKEGYKGDIEYRDQTLSYLSISEKHINQEYDKIISMQEVAEQSYDDMKTYIMTRDWVNAKITEEVDKLNANQKIFAKKYNIQIEQNTSELVKKMKMTNDVYENHTELSLLFFKVNFLESILLKAIESKDISAIQQNCNALEYYSNDGLEKLKKIKPYKNDMSLVLATKKVLAFTTKEAIELSPMLTLFLMLNKKLEDSKKIIDNKSASNQTKEEIINFNKLVDVVNKEVGNYNSSINKFNTERTNIVNNWYAIGDNFIAKYVPID